MNYEVQLIPFDKVFADEDFNCRGEIRIDDVGDLVRSIYERFLDTPISVQPAADVKGGLPSGFDFRIISGHRRHTAWRVLRRTYPDDARFKTIPAFVRPGMSEIEVRVMNLSENLDRKELNILQEANAIKALFEAGVPRDHVALKIKKSSGWVQTRFNLLSLPVEIQMDAAAGFLTQLQIKQLYSLESVEDQYAAVRKIKEAKMNGEKITEAVGKKKKMTTAVKKERKSAEIYEMMEILAKAVGYGLHTRFGAWVTGAISTAEFFDDVKAEATKQGKTFYPPLEF